jgi:hypothetical protein
MPSSCALLAIDAGGPFHLEAHDAGRRIRLRKRAKLLDFLVTPRLAASGAGTSGLSFADASCRLASRGASMLVVPFNSRSTPHICSRANVVHDYSVVQALYARRGCVSYEVTMSFVAI